MKLSTMAAVAAVMMFAGAAAAQEQGQGGGQGGGRGQACAADVQKMCSDKTDRAGRMQCLNDNHDKLSDGCKTVVDAMRARMQSGGGNTTAPAKPN